MTLRETVVVAGYRVTAKDGRIFITETDDHDRGLRPGDATALAVTLRAASQQAIRQGRADR